MWVWINCWVQIRIRLIKKGFKIFLIISHLHFTWFKYLGNIKGDKGNDGPQSNIINITNNKSLVIAPSEAGEYLLDTSKSDLYCSTNGSWGNPICNLKGESGVTGASSSFFSVNSFNCCYCSARVSSGVNVNWIDCSWTCAWLLFSLIFLSSLYHYQYITTWIFSLN